jgi:NADPH-dependent 2,4-dienoyl-CoA reductase/sulfur reductase-like enzyme
VPRRRDPSPAGAGLVIVGGDAAGMSAAAEARRADPALRITVLERGPDVAYAACGIPYWIAGEVDDAGALIAHDAEYFRRERGIEVRTGAEAVAVDPEARRVTTAGGEQVAYDDLVIATGARPILPPIPGADLPGVVALRDLESARRIQALLDGREAPRALIVGSGPVGLEMAEALCARGAAVDVVELAPRLLPALPEAIAEPVAEAVAGACAAVHLGTTLERIVAHADGAGLVATIDGRDARYDVVLLGVGVVPNAELAAEAGCALGDRGAILVDRRGRTSVEGIWAAGDCATAWQRQLGRQRWIPFATTANAQGRVTGSNVAGRPRRFAGVLGSWVSTAYGVGFGSTGLDVDAAADAGFRPEALHRDGRDRSGYIPGARPVRVRLVWDGPTGRLLGGQVSGRGEVATQLHVISTALAGGLTVGELAEVDMGYVPPLSALRGPVERAAAAAIGDAA